MAVNVREALEAQAGLFFFSRALRLRTHLPAFASYDCASEISRYHLVVCLPLRAMMKATIATKTIRMMIICQFTMTSWPN